MGDQWSRLAVKIFRADAATRELLYSTDEGETLNTDQFIDEPMRVYGLITGSLFQLRAPFIIWSNCYISFCIRTGREYYYVFTMFG